MAGGAAHCVVITTCGGREEAGRLASALVEEGLAACVQMMEIESVYRWRGKVVTDGEIGLYIKTRFDRYPAVERCIRTHHSYEVPEIVALPIEAGAPDYLAWIDESVS